MYTRMGCHLCEAVEEVMRKVQKKHAFNLERIDIDRDSAAFALYQHEIPVVMVNGREVARHRMDSSDFERALGELC